jgi:hypothetical protein
MADQKPTSIYATQKLLDESDITPHSRLYSQQPTTKDEMRKSVELLARTGSLLLQITGAKACCMKMKWLQMV